MIHRRTLIALLGLALSAAPVSAVTVTAPKGPVEVFARADLVDLLAVARLTGAEVAFAPAAGSYTAVLGDHQVQFTPGGTLAVVDGRLISLPGPVRLLEGHVVGAVATANTLIAPLGFALRGPPTALELVVLGGERLDVSIVHDESGALVVLRGTSQRPRVTTSPGVVTVQFPNPITLDHPVAPVGELAGAELKDDTLTIRLIPGVEVTGSYPLDNPPRYVIRIGKSEVAPATAAGNEPKRGPLVVLDPGHGGEDQGAKGPDGELEKDITLAVARLVAAQLQAQGISVRLTREGDETLSLTDRTALANRLHADVFVSIHANASQARGARGAETYFMSADASDDQAAQSAQRENASASPDTVQLILWDLAHNANLSASSRLALTIQERLNAMQETKDRGIRQAPFVVLTGATMPAALVEIGFLSNPTEVARLTSPAGQQELAVALAEAIVTYLRTPEPTVAPSPSTSATPSAAPTP